jgi:outer membrane immunogenic protein
MLSCIGNASDSQEEEIIVIRKLLAAAAFVALGSGSVFAADMPAAYTKAPMIQAAYNWTGFYLGANGGGGIAASDHSDPDCFSCADTKFHTPFGTVGVQAGYNYQFGNTVIGVEGDYNWASVDKTKFFALDNGSQAGTTQFRMREFATVRARGGLAVDRTFIYATAGVAFAHVQNTTLLGAAAVPVLIREQASEDTWKTGLAVGGGVEFALTQNWTLKGEYLYMMFQDSEATLFRTPAGGTGATCSFNVNCRMNYAESVQLARLGINYRW